IFKNAPVIGFGRHQTLLGHLAFGDVLGDSCDPVYLRFLVANWKPPIMDPANRSIRTQDPIDLIVLPRSLTRQGSDYPALIVGMNGFDPAPWRSIETLTTLPPDSFIARTDVNNPVLIRICHPEHFMNVLRQLSEALFAETQRLILSGQ